MNNSNINFANLSHEALEALGYKVITKKSQAKTRRTRKSVFGVRPSMNNARHAAPVKAQYGNEVGSKIQN